MEAVTRIWTFRALDDITYEIESTRLFNSSSREKSQNEYDKNTVPMICRQ
jgi:hypothetical protein